MLGLTQLGIAHTALSLVAVVTGFMAFVKHKEISTRNRRGQVYLASTFLTAATGLFIFEHGGFGPPHVLAIMTLAALAVGLLAAVTTAFGAASRVVRAVAFTSTAFFHTIPGFTESLTRLPAGDPVFDSQDAPEFKAIHGTLLAVFAIGLYLQLRWMRRHDA